tara:strand:- start:167 stop:526 length:360 start_codon:yes stop_codon:yes gene_type:complete
MEITNLKSAAQAMTETSDLVSGAPLFIGIICKGNGFHLVGVGSSDHWSATCAHNQKVLGTYNVSHMSQREAMFAALHMGELATRLKDLGLNRASINHLLNRTGQSFEKGDLTVFLKRAA